MAILDVPIIEAKQENLESGQLGSQFQLRMDICGEEAPSIFQDDFRFLFQSCKIQKAMNVE